MDIINKDILDDKKLLNECVVSFDDLRKCRKTDSWYYYMIKKYADRCNSDDVLTYVDAIYTDKKYQSDSYQISLSMDQPKKPTDRNTAKALIANSECDISNLFEPSDDWISIVNKNAAYAIYAPIDIQRTLLKIVSTAPIKIFNNMVKTSAVCTELLAILVARDTEIINAVDNWWLHDIKLGRLSSRVKIANVDDYQLANVLDITDESHLYIAKTRKMLDMFNYQPKSTKQSTKYDVYDITWFSKISEINYIKEACIAALEADPDNIQYVRCKNKYIYIQFAKKYPHKICNITDLPYKAAVKLIKLGYVNVPVVRAHIVKYLTDRPTLVLKFDLTYEEWRSLVNCKPALIKVLYDAKYAYFVKYIEDYYKKCKISVNDHNLLKVISISKLVNEVVKINDKFIQAFHVPRSFIKKPEHLYQYHTYINWPYYSRQYGKDMFDWIIKNLDDVIATQKCCAL